MSEQTYPVSPGATRVYAVFVDTAKPRPFVHSWFRDLDMARQVAGDIGGRVAEMTFVDAHVVDIREAS